MTRLFALAITAVLVSLSFAACGGGSASSDGPPPTSPAASSASPPARPRPGPLERREARTDRRTAGRAAPFVVLGADNSVPTFGHEAPAAERRAAEARVRAFLLARAAEDWPRVCAYLAAGARRGFEQLGGHRGRCAAALAGLSAGSPPVRPLRRALLSLRVHGSHAFALFIAPGARQYMLPMFREAGLWKMTQPAPIAYPPGQTG
jgi:hypothetical protein